MHNGTLMLVATVAVGAVICTACNVSGPTAPNPLLGEWNTPFGAPPFDLASRRIDGAAPGPITHHAFSVVITRGRLS